MPVGLLFQLTGRKTFTRCGVLILPKNKATVYKEVFAFRERELHTENNCWSRLSDGQGRFKHCHGRPSDQDTIVLQLAMQFPASF